MSRLETMPQTCVHEQEREEDKSSLVLKHRIHFKTTFEFWSVGTGILELYLLEWVHRCS